jgi:hypothetical protein
LTAISNHGGWGRISLEPREKGDAMKVKTSLKAGPEMIVGPNT